MVYLCSVWLKNTVSEIQLYDLKKLKHKLMKFFCDSHVKTNENQENTA